MAVPVQTDLRGPGAARQVVAHCLARLVAPRIMCETQLLVSELVTNSLRHGELDERDAVLVRVYLAAEILRVEVENPATAGVVALSSRGHGTTVWFEMARA
jgi:anti-sigma regulatory factor (Ser/Thr protein kinase)